MGPFMEEVLTPVLISRPMPEHDVRETLTSVLYTSPGAHARNPPVGPALKCSILKPTQRELCLLTAPGGGGGTAGGGGFLASALEETLTPSS